MTVDELIAKWWGKRGGAERSNLASFIPDLCEALDLPRPGAAEAGRLGDYEYEGSVPGGSFRSLKASGSIDLYKRGCFVMEAKQSRLSEADRNNPGLFDVDEAAPRAPSGASYDRLMLDARRQAENYAKNLPGDHPTAPFLIVCDVGRAFEIYFDYSGNGRGYNFFPDKQSYRIELPALRDQAVQDRLRAVWLDPKSIDPRLKSAEVTRGVATRLAEVSKWLEAVQRQKTSGLSSYERSLAVEESSLFLMRLLFCMFAEDIGLLPSEKFTAFLKRSIDNDGLFENGLADLWSKMGSATPQNRFAYALEEQVRYFNGGLFSEQATTYGLDTSSIGELYQAAKADWRKVEPAIFGTLLEQALTPEERAKLGAHYTPRPYVERLVQATIMDVLETEWHVVEEAPEAEVPAAAAAFHDRIAALRILDPACGTGNFLYVAMELLQGLESKVIDLIQRTGGQASPRVGPHQFFGLELNPRAAKIAELVLWIGWLRNRLHDDPDAVPEPVLAESASINFGRHGGYDAILARGETGDPDYEKPLLAAWPEADFIVGNPPFIAGQDIRAELGGDYAEAVWRANPRVGGGADLVMQWWDHAARLLTAAGSPLLRFGFVTTNSITQVFSRKVIENYLGSLSLIFAIANHPWLRAPPKEAGQRRKKGTGKDKGPAAVRIAMTVAEVGEHEGCALSVLREAELNTDHPRIEYHLPMLGRINADLTVGTDTTAVRRLVANAGICHDGVKLHGKGFAVTRSEAKALGLGRREGLERHIRPYRNGRDLTGRTPEAVAGKFVIDLFGLDEKEVRTRYPEVYQHLLATVKPERDRNRRATYKDNWWIFGEPRRDLRPGLVGLNRYVGTVDTAKHRVFQFLTVGTLVDDGVVIAATSDAFHLGVLSSSAHLCWTLQLGGWLGAGNDNRYNKTQTFDPYPFPDSTSKQRVTIADLAEELDATRATALGEVPGLTMTELYNLRGRWRAGAEMDLIEQARVHAARAPIVDRLHEQIDEAVAEAYGWEWPLPSAEIVSRVVALNAERAAEEAAGHVRWLRPDYQEPRFGKRSKDDKVETPTP